MSREIERVSTAIMFTDMVGYSSIVERDERLGLELLEEHRRLARDLFAHHEGTEIKTIGDAFLITFRDPLQAVLCGVALQTELQHRNQAAARDRQFSIRIGIHSGEVSLKNGDVLGDAVNIAARIEPIARSGCICITETVQQAVEGKIPDPIVKLGRAELKNLESRLTLYEVVPPGLRPRRLLRRAGFIAARKSVRVAAIAVLTAAAVAGGTTLISRSSRCADGSSRLAQVWSPEVRSRLDKAFRATQNPGAARIWMSAERVLDRYALGWLETYRSSCEDTNVRHSQTAKTYALQLSCLERRLQEMKKLTDVMASADATVVDGAVQATFHLSDVHVCREPSFLSSMHSTNQADDLQLFNQLAEAKALQSAGKYAEATQRAEGSVQRAREERNQTAESEGLFRLASIEKQSGQFAISEEKMFEAFLAGQGSGNEVIAAEAAIELTDLTGYQGARPSEGMRWSRIAATLLGRFEGLPELRARLLSNIGCIHYRNGSFSTSENLHRQALAALGAEGQEIFRIEVQNRLSGTLYEQGRFSEQLAVDTATLDKYELLLGPSHPTLIFALQHLAAAEFGLGRYAEALEHVDRALAIAPTGASSARSYVGQTRGAVLAHLMRWDEAIAQLEETQRALKQTLGDKHPDLIDTLEPLAYAQLGRDHPREAISLCAEGLNLLGAKSNHLSIARCLEIQGAANLRQGNAQEALKKFSLAVAHVELRLGTDTPLLQEFLTERGFTELDLNLPEAARGDFDRAISLSKHRASNPAASARAHFGLARLLPPGPEAMEQIAKATALSARAQGVDARVLEEIADWREAAAQPRRPVNATVTPRQSALTDPAPAL